MRPIWSADGSKLGFISERNNSNYDVWFAWLKKADWLRTEEEWKDYKEEKEENKEKDTSKTVEPVEIDFDGIHKRLVQVTSLPSDEYNYEISKDGETFYFTASSNTAKGTDLYKIKWDGDDLKEITSGGQRPYGLSLEEEGKYLYMLKHGGSLARLKTDNDKLETLPYKAKMTINHPKEQEQKFEEAWRTLKVGFYDPNFHGNDWAALKEKYKPWAMKASTERDFRAMFNVMLGQINASHMGMYGSDRAETQDETTGLLGLELKPSDDGMVVDRVVMNSPADKSFSKIEPGETILSVNGNKVNDENNFYSYLVNTVDEEVVVEVENEDGEEREVVIRPTRSLNNELYEEWVEERKELTEKYSNGRLGYLHIEGMSWPSFERFERELTASGLGKEGIVIDVRFNGGGWTTDYLMTVLNVDQHAYTVPRGATDNLEKNHEKFREHYPYGERLPYAAWTKPSIAMCNQNSYSNAEIFSHAYKTLGIGKLVGKPTFGAVISTGGRGLIDGSYVRLPFRGWYVKATDMNMELNPAVPDIVVDNEPDSKAEGRDEQLKKAVDELLKQIDSE
jgi:C-terminal processing protease CtpA/Prc